MKRTPYKICLKKCCQTKSLITDPVTTKCGSWVRSLTPLYNMEGKDIIGVLGLSYPSGEWKESLYKDIIPDIIIVIFINLKHFTFDECFFAL